jgi:nicotinate-nucleotide adenylyltransferase
MKRYGILGGTFDPPHIAHYTLAEEVRNILNLDKIIFIPSAVPPLKDTDKIIEIKHRLVMAKIAFERNKYFEVSDIETKNTISKSYTIDTLIKLNEMYKNESVKFYLILGLDSIIDFPKWKTPEKLFELAEIVILNRPGSKISDVKREYAEKVLFINAPLMDISSTLIRENVRKNKSIKSLVLPEIEKYIKQNNLYK